MIKSLSIRNLAPLFVTVAILFTPLMASALQDSGPAVPPSTQDSGNAVPPSQTDFRPPPSPYVTPGAYPSSVTPTCNGAECSVQNPLAVSSFCDLLKIVLQALLILGLPVAVIFLVLAGFQYITAYGNEGKLTKAHENIKWTVIGVAIFLGAWTIAQIIKATLVSLGVSGFGSC